MTKREKTIEDFEYLTQRAKLFLTYLDKNNLSTIFPLREKAWDDLNEIIKSGSKRKMKILNEIIDKIIIGKNPLNIENRHQILSLFNERLNEGKNTLIEKKIELYEKIISNGIIDSNQMINDAIEIQNSEILGLSADEKSKLKEIISLSMRKRLDKM
jgi:hypothetical protein